MFPARRLAVLSFVVVAVVASQVWSRVSAHGKAVPPDRSVASTGPTAPDMAKSADTAGAAAPAASPTATAATPGGRESLRFGERGAVTLREIPDGRFRRELAALAPGAQQRALAQLEKLRVPRNDVASLRADRNGRLFYHCPPPSAAQLETALAVAERETAVKKTAQAAPVPPAAAVPISSPPVRHSRPGATKVIYLDFNGETITGTAWNEDGEATYVALPYDSDGNTATFSDGEQAMIVEIWARLAEDFAPFDVDVTTEKPATPFTTQTGVILFTKSTDGNGKVMPDGATAGGIGYLDVFGDSNYAYNSPALVYSDKYYGDAGNLADAGSHEIGHNLGLSHDGTASDEYYEGHYQPGTPSWGPLMGAPYYRTMTQWSKGEYAHANNNQDDMAIIAADLGYRADDYGDSNGSAAPLSGTLAASGLIQSAADRDRFSFTTATGVIQFDASSRPVADSYYGLDLDVALELYDADGNLLVSADDSGSVTQTLNYGVTAGTYYLRVKGVGCGNPYNEISPSGYTAYGSLGGYSITGTFSPGVAPQITQNPSSPTVTVGQSAGFYAYASGTPAPAYQWQRLPAGTSTWANLPEGAPYSGTATYNLTVNNPTVAMSGDQFRVVATNSSGTATSNPAALTVNPVAPPTIYYGPYGTSTTVGASVYFSVNVSSVVAVTYVWQRQAAGTGSWVDVTNDGTYSGANSGYLTVNLPTLAMSGDKFRVTVSNGGGSVVSSEVTLTVTPVVAPSITGMQASVTVAYGNSLNFYPSVNGTYPVTYQWYFNDAPIANATSSYYYINNVKGTQAGNYTLKATNSAGTASATTQVTVSELAPITISQGPASQEVVKGNSASFNVQVTGSQPITYQWYRNGVAIAYATSNYYSVYSVTAADAASYTVTVTNDAGSVTSAPATLTVLPAEPPRITDYYVPTTLSSTSSFSTSVSVSGTGPMSYQWYKDGVAIAGANSSSYYVYNNITPAMAGNYTVQVTNEVGTATSPDGWAAWSAGSTVPWLGVARQGDIVYFLLTTPGRILRYDLAQETWLPVTYTPETKVPTAFLPTAEGVFIAYGKDLVRRDLALQNETAVGTSTNAINLLLAAGDYIYFRDNDNYSSNLRSFNRSTLAAGAWSSTNTYNNWNGLGGNNRVAYISASNLLLVMASYDLERYTVSGASVTGMSSSGLSNWFKLSPPLVLSPDQSLLLLGSGIVVSTSSLDYAGSLGRAFDDAAFLDNSSIVALRGRKLTEHSGTGWVPVGEYTLATDGVNLFRRGEKLFVFGPPSGSSSPAVQKVTTGAFNELPAASAGSPVNRKVSLDDMFMGANGTLHIVSRSEHGVLRWDATTRQFLPTLPLRGRPVRSSYAPVFDRLVLSYADGALTDLFPSSAPAEEIFGNTPADNRVSGMATMDDMSALSVRQLNSSSEMRLVVGGQGEIKYFPKSSYYSGGVQFWLSSSRRLYASASYYDNALSYFNVSGVGVIDSNAAGTAQNIVSPVRPNPEGTLLLSANGKVYISDLQLAATLPNPVADGAWQPNSLFTIRVRPNGTQVQKWARITYEAEGSLVLPGIPQRIFRIDDTSLVVVTTVDGYLVFNVVSNALEVLATVTNDATYIPGRPALFNAAAYLTNNGDVAAGIGNVPDKLDQAWRHYYRYGITEGRTDGDFNAQAYMAQYPGAGSDVRAAALYWYTVGRKNGDRIPAGFSVAGYFLRNSDIAATFANDKYGAWLHYYNYGVIEGRSYDANFIVDEYLELNPDLKSSFGTDKQAALMHWLMYGHPVEDRMGRVPIGFNVDSYLARYPDLQAVFGDITPKAVRNVTVWRHYVAYGTLEGRTDGDFEAYNYLATNPDLAAVFGSDIRAAALHWFFYGRREGRRIPGGFDVTDYRARYPDIVVGLGDDLYGSWLHYRDTGVTEGRVFGELFRPADYLALNPDVAAVIGSSYRDALLHWLYFGQFEGRRGKF